MTSGVEFASNLRVEWNQRASAEEEVMFLTKMKKRVALTIILAAISAALPLFGQTGGIAGDVKDDKGTPMVGHPVIIERTDIKGIYKAKTDKHGHYIYIGLPIGNYKITLQDPSGKEIYHFGGVHIGLGDPTVQDFDMAKEKSEQAKEVQSNPELKKQLEQHNEAEKEQKQLSGLKALFDQAQALYADKKYTEAAAMFEQAVPLAKDKNLAAVLSRLGDSYDKANQHDKAVESYQKAIAANPADAELHNSLGTVYARSNKIADAQAEFKKSAELNPAGASRAYFNLGVVMYNSGKMDEASEAFKKATDLDASYADAYFWQSLALMGKATMEGDKMVVPPGTVEALQSYLKLQPNGTNAPTAQQMLQTIQGQVQTEMKVDKKKKKS
jgi:tetratricopeptide (TPR) repeat protein